MVHEVEEPVRANAGETEEETASGDGWRQEAYWSLGSVGAAVIQGLCVFAVAAAPIRTLLGITSVAAASGSSFIHSDAVRFTLRYAGGLLALITLYVTWNGWRLRRRPASRWRARPLSSREKRAMWIGLASAAVSILLIFAEIWAHKVMHP